LFFILRECAFDLNIDPVGPKIIFLAGIVLILYRQQHEHLSVSFDIALEKSILDAIFDTRVGFLVYQEDVVADVR